MAEPSGRVPLREIWRQLPRFVRLALPALGLVFALLWVLWARCGVGGCPSVDRLAAYQPGGAPRLLDRQGRVFADLAPVEGQVVKLRSLPAHVPQAFLAVEDQRFYGHQGVDWWRVMGAMVANIRAGRYEEGFSTITMQLARNVFPSQIRARERSLARKVLEIRVAAEIESRFSKDEILELYLNHIYFGNGARGIEAASRHYFRVPARDLTLTQAALLAALPKGPTLYDPRRHPDQARERRNLVLSLMEQQERVPAKAAASGREAPLGVVRRSRAASPEQVIAPYFVEQVRRDLEERLGAALYDEPLRVLTTLDVATQRAAEEELSRQLAAIESGGLGRFGGPRYVPGAQTNGEGTTYLQGAVVALEASTGDVLAWVGGRDFRHSRFDRVRAARRQAGSAFKPFVYAAALGDGHTLSEHLEDAPLRVRLDRNNSWEPKNFDGVFEGKVTVRDALVRSRNIPTVRLAGAVGLGDVADLAQDAGVQSPIPETPAMPLGTVALSPLELASAYTVFATLGERAEPRLVLRVERPNGEVVWKADDPERRRVLDPGIAFLVTDVLQDALVRGTGTAVRQAGFAGPAAGKTGTTNDGTDAWFIGYTPDLVAAVWIGFDQPRPIMAQATGGRLAAPVWGRTMVRVYRDRKLPPAWAAPKEVLQAWVDPATGAILNQGCQPLDGGAYRELFVRTSLPDATCPLEGEPTIVADWPRGSGGDQEAGDLSIGGFPDLSGDSEPAPPPELEEIERSVEEWEKILKRRHRRFEDLREQVREWEKEVRGKRKQRRGDDDGRRRRRQRDRDDDD